MEGKDQDAGTHLADARSQPAGNGITGLFQEDSMNIIIIGCGKVGRALAAQLSEENHNVTVVDTNASIVRSVSTSHDVMGVTGNGASFEVLQSAGVMKADILIMLLDGRVPDEGACVELGIGYANHKRCYGIKGDARSVELDMDLNPMITGCFTKLFYNLDNEELIKSLEEYLKDNDL